MATTTFQPGGYSGRPYGSFAGKEASAAGGSAHNPGRITTLHGGGYPGRLYGDFTGKTPSSGGGGAHNPGRITSLQAGGYSGILQSFLAKTASSGVVSQISSDLGPTPTLYAALSNEVSADLWTL